VNLQVFGVVGRDDKLIDHGDGALVANRRSLRASAERPAFAPARVFRLLLSRDSAERERLSRRRGLVGAA